MSTTIYSVVVHCGILWLRCSVYDFLPFLFSFFSDELREHLKNAPKAIMAQQRPGTSESDSDSSDDSSSEGLWEISLSSN